MKKILFSLIMLCSFMFVSCDDKCEFNRLIEEDYDEIIVDKTDPKDRMFEVRVDFDTVLTAENVKVSKYLAIFQCHKTIVKVYRDLKAGTREVVRTPGFVVSDNRIYPNTFAYDLDEAIQILKEQKKFEVPEATKMTIRKPLTPKEEFRRTFYIFGQKSTGFVTVDALSGEVGNIK